MVKTLSYEEYEEAKEKLYEDYKTNFKYFFDDLITKLPDELKTSDKIEQQMKINLGDLYLKIQTTEENIQNLKRNVEEKQTITTDQLNKLRETRDSNSKLTEQLNQKYDNMESEVEEADDKQEKYGNALISKGMSEKEVKKDPTYIKLFQDVRNIEEKMRTLRNDLAQNQQNMRNQEQELKDAWIEADKILDVEIMKYKVEILKASIRQAEEAKIILKNIVTAKADAEKKAESELTKGFDEAEAVWDDPERRHHQVQVVNRQLGDNLKQARTNTLNDEIRNAKEAYFYAVKFTQMDNDKALKYVTENAPQELKDLQKRLFNRVKLLSQMAREEHDIKLNNGTIFLGGGYDKDKYIQFTLSRDSLHIIQNVIILSIFKFARYTYYKKNIVNYGNELVYLLDYVMTLIICIIFYILGFEKISIGIFIDQLLSMVLYDKINDDKALLLPYYLPLVLI